MHKLYAEIIDECIEKFGLEDGRTFNFSLLDFRDEVFHNYGLKHPLPEPAITRLLTHAQKYIAQYHRNHPALAKLTEYLLDDLRNLPPFDEPVKTIFEILFEGRPAADIPHLTYKNLARFVSFLPLKNYWDNSGVIFRRACQDETTFSKIYLCEYRYDEQHRRPGEALCREIEIPESETGADDLAQKLTALQQKPFGLNADYFGLQLDDRDLYDLYGKLFDLFNWGPSNPEPVIDYLDERAHEFSFYNCIFPVVFHGIYYGIAYFDLPADFFQEPRPAVEKLSRILTKGWTYINHYFPAMIIDAYNSRLIGRFTREPVASAGEVVKLVSSKVPFRFCFDRHTRTAYYFTLALGEIGKNMQRLLLDEGWEGGLADLPNEVLLQGIVSHPERLRAIPQEILGEDLIFCFDMNDLPGREKCLPILESHLAQAAFVLQTMKDQAERKALEDRNRILDMFAHDTKTTRELLIADLKEGMDSDLAASQLIEQGNKERVMHDYLLNRRSLLAEEMEHKPEIEISLPRLFADQFVKCWRAWVKSRRFRTSFRRNRHPDFPLSADSSLKDCQAFLEDRFRRHADQPDRACLAILRDSFICLADSAMIRVSAPPLLLQEHAVFRIEAILYNLLNNFFKHAAPSPLTGCNECVMDMLATPMPEAVNFRFVFSNSTSTKERYKEDVKELLRDGHEIHGLHIIRHLIEMDTGGRQPDFKIRQENYLWHIEIGRDCRGCHEKVLVDSRA